MTTTTEPLKPNEAHNKVIGKIMRWPVIPNDFYAMLEGAEHEPHWGGYLKRIEAFDKLFRLTPDRHNSSRKLFDDAPFNDHTLFRQHDGNLVLVTQPYPRHTEAEVAQWLTSIEPRLVRWGVSQEWSFYLPGKSMLIYVEATFQGKRPLQ